MGTIHYTTKPRVQPFLPRITARGGLGAAPRSYLTTAAARDGAAHDLTEWVRRDTQRVADGLLAPRHAACFWPSSRGAARGLVLMYHGFSGGPWQLHDEAQRLNSAGLDIFCAPLAGHGSLTQSGLSPHTLPTAGQAERYLDEAERQYQSAAAHARAMGIPLHIYGYSLGATLGIHVARDHADSVKSLVAIAPILTPAKREGRWTFHAANVLAQTAFGRNILDEVASGWGPAAPSLSWPGHWHFSLGNLITPAQVGQSVLHDPRPLPMPTQVVLSDFDETCAPEPTREFFNRYASHHAIMTFGEKARVTHAMVSAVENSNRASRDFLGTTTTNFLAGEMFERGTYAAPPAALDLFAIG